ncbi:hypothetical protein D9M73_171120 [compost metagenome]
MKGRCLVGAGSRTFGENDQGLTVFQRVGRRVEHVHAAVVADVFGAAQRAAGEKVVPEALLDHAVGVTHQADQKHHVDQRGVIGKDHLPGTTELFRAFNVVGQHPGTGHEAHKNPETAADRLPGPQPMGPGVARQAVQHRENHQAQAQPAQPEQGEARGGGQQTPVIGVAVFLGHGLRCQVHTRFFQACWQVVCWPSSAHSRFSA